MAKQNSGSEEPKNENTEVTPDDNKSGDNSNNSQSKEEDNMANKKKKVVLVPLDIRDPKAKIRLKDHSGKNVFYTPEDAIKPHIYKTLSQNSKDLLQKGKSVSNMLKEIE